MKTIKHKAQKMIMIMITITAILFVSNVLGDDDGPSIVAIGEATLNPERIVFKETHLKAQLTDQQRSLAKEFIQLFHDDFSYYRRRFKVEISQKDKAQKDKAQKNKGGDYLVEWDIFNPSKGKEKRTLEGFQYELKSYDMNSSRDLFMAQGLVSPKDVRTVGHRLANSLYKAIVKKDSIFQSKIIFVSDKTGHKELYIMDFDGRRIKQLTSHKGNVISPAISYDGKKIAYSLIEGGKRKRNSKRNSKRKRKRRRNIDLYLYDMDKKRSKIISARKGINSGAIFTPDGKGLFLTLSHVGNAEIYYMNLATKALRRITRHYASDVDPSLSMDGTLMAFLSGRSGRAMVYILDPRGEEKDVKRITFIGRFNATPRFAPQGKEIVFSSWVGQGFDLYRINADGTGLVRLTKNFGPSEDPTYSNDGQFIAFSSKKLLSRKRAVQNIYMMDKEGEQIRPITRKMGSCITPRWSK